MIKKTGTLTLVFGLVLIVSGCIGTLHPTKIPNSSTPTETVTKFPTVTVTDSPTMTATPNQYSVDKSKLSKTPISYDYLTTHLDEFVQGPDPWAVGTEAFIQWDITELTPALGDLLAREPNIQVVSASVGNGRIELGCRPSSPITGQMEFFYFDHNGIIYPVYLIQGFRTTDQSPVDIGVILVQDYWINETSNYFGFKTVDALAEGDYKVIQVTAFYEPSDHLFQEVNDLIASGVSSVDRDNSYYYIGFGFIFLEK